MMNFFYLPFYSMLSVIFIYSTNGLYSTLNTKKLEIKRSIFHLFSSTNAYYVKITACVINPESKPITNYTILVPFLEALDILATFDII